MYTIFRPLANWQFSNVGPTVFPTSSESKHWFWWAAINSFEDLELGISHGHATHLPVQPAQVVSSDHPRVLLSGHGAYDWCPSSPWLASLSGSVLTSWFSDPWSTWPWTGDAPKRSTLRWWNPENQNDVSEKFLRRLQFPAIHLSGAPAFKLLYFMYEGI